MPAGVQGIRAPPFSPTNKKLPYHVGYEREKERWKLEKLTACNEKKSPMVKRKKKETSNSVEWLRVFPRTETRRLVKNLRPKKSRFSSIWALFLLPDDAIYTEKKYHPICGITESLMYYTLVTIPFFPIFFSTFLSSSSSRNQFEKAYNALFTVSPFLTRDHFPVLDLKKRDPLFCGKKVNRRLIGKKFSNCYQIRSRGSSITHQKEIKPCYVLRDANTLYGFCRKKRI